MNAKIIAVLCFFFAFAAVKGATDEYGNEMEDIATSNDETYSDETPVETKKSVEKVEDLASETTSLVQQDSGDSDADKHKGFCHYGIAAWFKPGLAIRCNCMKCTCKEGGVWDCMYNFAYCPYFYCGNQIYNPATQICCCGKVHGKKSNWACCGYFYYNTRASQCCNYYSVKPSKAKCPRHQV